MSNRHIYALATAVALGTVAVAGIFAGMSTQFTATSGPSALLFAFEAAVIGGLGSLWGTLAGGMVLGVAQTLGGQINPADQILAGHLVFLAVLAFRPQGLFRRAGRPGRAEQKLIVYLLAALGCGAAGALTLANSLQVAPDSAFSVQWTAYMIFCVIVGGLGTIEGPVIGALLFFELQDRLSTHGVWYLILLGVVAIVMTIRFRKGIWGLLASRTRLSFFPTSYRLRPAGVQQAPAAGADPQQSNPADPAARVT